MWQGIIGHDDVVERFRRSLASGRLASTYLFVGPAGVGKRSFALELARAMLCQNREETHHAERDEYILAACGECASCRLTAAGNHPDLLQIAKPEDKSFIPVEKFIGPTERRMREGLCHDLGLKPLMGGMRVAIVDDADYLNQEGANCLLKTLEEPPPKSLLILIGTSAARQLPTIRSRCQIVRFRPLDDDVLADLLVSSGRVPVRDDANRIAASSEGSLERALELADPAVWNFRRRLLERLAVPVVDSIALARDVTAYLDEAGSEASARRARLWQVIGFAAEYYRELMRSHCGVASATDSDLHEAVGRGLASGHGDAETARTALARCLQTDEHVERNANVATVLECWLDDLERIALTGEPVGL